MSQEELSTFLQENLLTLLCFDDQRAPVICSAVEASLFEGDYKSVAVEAYKYIRKSSRAPKEHIADLLEDILSQEDRKAKRFRLIIKAMRQSKDSIDGDFVMGRLASFIRRQKLKGATLEVAEIFNTGRMDEEAIDRVESIFTSVLHEKMTLFDAGIFLGKPSKSLTFLDNPENDVFPTGIKELDRFRLGPVRKGLHLFIGLPKAGKTHWLVNLGKNSYRAGLKICHVSLEMSEEKISQRYFQALFAISKRPIETGKLGSKITKFRIDEDGKLAGLRQRSFKPKHTLQDRGIKKYFRRRLKFLGSRLNRIVIKSFPTGQLTVPQLDAYLQTLEVQHGFVPDLLIIDYPQLMKMDSKNLRGDLGRTVIGLRGIAGERNMAVAAVAQSHRKGLSSKLVGVGNIGEDFSQIATADVVLTYSRTKQEKALGLARLHVGASRDEEDDFTVLVSQHYATGQFCRQSVRMQKQYWDILEAEAGESKEDEEEEEDNSSSSMY